MTSPNKLIRIGSVALELLIAGFLVAMVLMHARTPEAKAAPRAAEPAAIMGLLSQGGTVCITDASKTETLTYDSGSGAYTFKVCGTGFTLSGTGTIRIVNGTIYLTDSKPDRRINAGFLIGQGTGRAVVTFIPAAGIYQTFSINQTNPFQACGC